MRDNKKTDEEDLSPESPNDPGVTSRQGDKDEEDAEVAAGLYHDLYFHDLI
jgi:hypothetical protein